MLFDVFSSQFAGRVSCLVFFRWLLSLAPKQHLQVMFELLRSCCILPFSNLCTTLTIFHLCLTVSS